MEFRVPSSPATAVILTALEVEHRAVLRQLGKYAAEDVSGTRFHVGRFGRWRVTVAEVGAGNASAAATATRAIEHFKATIALFVGVAGGIKDVAIGDVVVGTKVYGYESGKETAEGFKVRPDLLNGAYGLVQSARSIRQGTTWKKRLDPSLNHENPKIFIAPIAAGEKVVASATAPTAEFINNHYGDAVAVEMEGRGFLEGVHISHPVQGGVVRGISDLLSGKSAADKAGSQELASDAASAVAFEILAQIRPPPIDPKRRTILYAIATALLVGWWASMYYEARQNADVIFKQDGVLGDQLAYRILSLTAEERLKERMPEGSTIIGRFGSLEKFFSVVAFRPFPLQVRPAPGWNPPQPDKISIQSDYDRWRTNRESSGPRILIETPETHYTGDLEELNKCRAAAKAQGGRNGTIPVPPFEAIGSIDPPSACWLFLEPKRSSMTITELLDKADRMGAWHYTNYFKPSPYVWYVAQTTKGVVSNINSYVWDERLYFSREVFPALSIEADDCEKFVIQTCVVYSRAPIVTAGTPQVRDQLPVDQDMVTTSALRSDQLYLIADIPSHDYVKSLTIIFPLNLDMSRYMEMVRMAEPFYWFHLQALKSIRDVPITINLQDRELTKLEFTNRIWFQSASSAALFGTKLSVSSLELGIVLLAIMAIDGSLSFFRSIQRRAEMT